MTTDEKIVDVIVKAPSEFPEPKGRLLSETYSSKALPPILGAFDLTAIYVSIIFFITNVNTAVGVGGGAATFTYWILAGVTFFIPCALATAQLGVMFPYEGSLYNWTHRAFGGYWSFFVGFCAWFPGVLLITSACSVIITMIQGLSNGTWLTEPWQQGLVLILLVIITGVLASQRFRTIQNVDNIIVGIIFLAVALIGISALLWLLRGNHPMTSFKAPSDWLTLNPGNFALFGITVQAYLGIEVPLNMGGEMQSSSTEKGSPGRRIITRHLLWGTALVLVGYFIVTFAMLSMQGTAQGSLPYSLVTTVSVGLNPFFGYVTAVCIMCAFLIAPTVYNYSYARLLLVAGIDQRLPMNLGKLSKNRVPVNAIIFQTVVAAFFAAAAYLFIPYMGQFGNPLVLSSDVYNVILAASTLVWSISTGFLLVNIAKFFLANRREVLKSLIMPLPVLWLSVVLGIVSCAVAIVGTLFYSWIPAQIDNRQWWYIIGAITILCLIIAAIGSMIASSEAAWQDLKH